MNVTATHRPHVRVRRSTAIAVLAIAAVVALVLALSIPRSTTPPVTTQVEATGAAETPAWNADAAKNRSRAFLAIVRGESPAGGMRELPAPLRKSARTPWLTAGSDGAGCR
jgi:hypothetical protein